MEHISNLFNLPVHLVKPKIKSERSYVLSLFLEKLNQDRGSYKPLTGTLIAIKLSHLSIQKLYEFYGFCNERGTFAKTCWWSLRTGNTKFSTPPKFDKKKWRSKLTT